MMKFIYTIAVAIAILNNNVSALEWNLRKVSVPSASRDNPDASAFNIETIVSAPSDDIALLLSIQNQEQVRLPLPDGTLHTFTVRPSPILSRELKESYPNIRSFEGETAPNDLLNRETRLKNERITVVFSVARTTASGTTLHAQYFSNKRGYMHLEPTASTTTNDIELSFRAASRDNTVREEPKVPFTCDTEDDTTRKLMEETLVSSHVELIDANRRKLQDAGCNIASLGNFQCDPDNNRPECNYDAGDCCGGFKARFAECTPNDDPTSCLCKDKNYLVVTPRTLRLAVATNVEYSALYNSNKEAVMAQIVHTFTRVAGVFRREAGIGFEIVYAHIETDPATRTIGNSGTFAVAQSLPAVFDGAIGNDGYDIGHCLTTTPGGVAGGIGVTCNPDTKGMGVTGRGDVTGNIHFVDIVVHEMGHQMGSHHMFSGCGGNPGTPGFRVEPGSGTSFMSYASICGSDNISDRMSPYFHTLSLESIRRYQSNPAGGATCGYLAEESPVPRPVVDAQISLLNPTERSCSIPPLTPFRLHAVNAPITEGYYYSWEQVDNTEESATNNLDDTPPADGALFRSIPPKQNDPSRTFPDLARIFGTSPENFHERLAPTARELEFVLGIRKEYIGRDTIDTTSFYLTDYSAFYVGDSVRVTVADVEPLKVTAADAIPDEAAGLVTIQVSWTGGNLASKMRVVVADGDVPNPDFSTLLASELDNNGKGEVTITLKEMCATQAGSQAQFHIMVESDLYLEGCSYFSIAPSPIVVDCSKITPPPTVAPTPENIIEVVYEYGPEDGNFTENGLGDDIPYQSNHIYKYSISGEQGKRILLEFSQLNLENNYDFLNVYDGEDDNAPLLMRHTGVGDGRVLMSSGNKVYMTLITDPIVEGPGFVVQHTSVDSSHTFKPTVSPTASPTEHREFIDVFAANDTQSFNMNVDVLSTITIHPSMLSSIVLSFDTATYGFYGRIVVQEPSQTTNSNISPENPVSTFEAKGGTIFIDFENFNEFPITISFTVTETALPVTQFGQVQNWNTLARETSHITVGELTSADANEGILFPRGYVSGTESSIRFAPTQQGPQTVCIISKGNVNDASYSYESNVLAFTIFEESDISAMDSFVNLFPSELGDVSNVPVLVSSSDNNPLDGYVLEATDVSITCGTTNAREAPGSFIFMFAMDPLTTKPAQSGSGVITQLDHEVIDMTQEGIVSSFATVSILATDGKPINLEFTQPPAPKFTTMLFASSLTTAVFHSEIEALYTFGNLGDSFVPYPAEELTIGGIDTLTMIVLENGGAVSIPSAYQITYSVGGEGNFTKATSPGHSGDQVNKLDVDPAKPVRFASGTLPFGTKEHALNERWEFVAPEGFALKLTFTVLDVEASADFVHVYSGTQVEEAHKVQSFSGSHVPPSMQVQGNSLVVRVARDASDDRTYRGVQGLVEVVREPESQWYVYVIGAMGVIVAAALVVVVKKSRDMQSMQEEDEEEAAAASAIEFMESRKQSSNEVGMHSANPLFNNGQL